MVAAQAEFDKAAEDVRAAAAENPGLKVLFASGTPEEAFYIANPSVNADLLFFKELGVDVVQPENPDNVPSYAGFTPVLVALAEAIRGSEKVID